MRFKTICFGLLLAYLSACEPEATPFPVDIPTPATATPTPGPPVPVRYALAPNTLDAVADRALLESSAQVTQLSEAVNLDVLGTQFDVIATYGTYPDATPSPSVVTLSLAINTSLQPLDNPALASILQRGTDTTALIAQLDVPGVQAVPGDDALSQSTLRAELANTGWPDGIDLSLAYENVMAVNALQAYWQALNIHINAFPLQDLNGQTHLTLFAWTTPEQRTSFAGTASSVIDLLTVPISYWAVPGLQISYSPQGWPIVTRQ